MSSATTKLRYSDEELQEFDQIIAQKLERARQELAYIKDQLTRKNDPGTDNTASSNKGLEDGSDALEKENLMNLAARMQKFINQLENAAIRIKNKTYGVCIDTGRLIPKERLRAVPHTQHTIEAKIGKG
jgi:RNA polymerase-binding transcription factor DksA